MVAARGLVPILAAIATAAAAALSACAATEPAERPPAAAVDRTPVQPPGEGRPERSESPGPPAEPPVAGATPAPATDALREVFPHVRVDIAQKLVEFDGTVPIDAHARDRRAGAPEGEPPRPRVVYLELVACTPDTKEHEVLVVTPARPSHVHAALLLIGLEPGRPGSWEWEGQQGRPIEPTGDPVEVAIAYRGEDGAEIEAPATEWIVNANTGEVFGSGEARGGWVFAGSVIRERGGRERYEADGAGTLIGLTTFGTETIAWRRVISPDSQVHEPEWIARAELVPRVGTPVVVRVRAIQEPTRSAIPD